MCDGLELRVRDMGYQGDRFIQNLVVGLRDKTEHTAAEPSDPIKHHFRVVLDACESALHHAVHLWTAGYSFPAADTTFLDVVARAIAGRNGNLSLTVIDKGDSANPRKQLGRLEELFGRALIMPIGYCPHGFEAWGKVHDCVCAGTRKGRRRRLR